MRKGEIMKITGVLPGGVYVGNLGIYPAESLRKLTPEEIQQHLAIPNGGIISTIIDTNTSGFNAAIDAIEKRQSDKPSISNVINDIWECVEELEEQQHELSKRLAFVEAFQKDEATRSAYTTYTYKPDDPEHGTITVNCSCGRKYELEATPRSYRGNLHD